MLGSQGWDAGYLITVFWNVTDVVPEENVIFSNLLHNKVTPKLVTWSHG
jgi:hypothetical protein